jgi:hypothetical protein
MALPGRRKCSHGLAGFTAGHPATFAGARGDYTPPCYNTIMFHPGICRACQLPPTDLNYLKALRARQRKLPHGWLARVSLNRWAWYRHCSGRCKGRVPYWTPEEYQRRRQSIKRLRRYWWRPGQSGNWAGRPRGAKDRRPRRKPQGIAAAITQQREDRARKIRTAQLAAVEAE